MPAAKADRSQRTIDQMLTKMRAKFVDLTPDQQINVIKVAIMWEKTKKFIKDEDEGSFFNSSSESETEDDDESESD